MGGDGAVFLQEMWIQKWQKRKLIWSRREIRNIQVEGVGKPVSASIGVAISPRDGATFPQLYRAADTAMYRVKKSDKDGFCISR